MDMAVKIWYPGGKDPRRIGRMAPDLAYTFVVLIQRWGVEDAEGKTFVFESASVDLGSMVPVLDIFLKMEV